MYLNQILQADQEKRTNHWKRHFVQTQDDKAAASCFEGLPRNLHNMLDFPKQNYGAIQDKDCGENYIKKISGK